MGGGGGGGCGGGQPRLLRHELAVQMRMAVPATMTYLFGRSLVSIALVFIGRMGDLQLAAAALANTSTNVSGLSIVVGMGTAVQTVCGQAYGARNYRKVAQTLQLGLLVFWAVCVPITALWWNSEKILLLCRQDAAVAHSAGQYIRWLIPFIWFFAAQTAVNSFLSAQKLMVRRPPHSSCTQLM
jgi:MATE family multidrug resistance protein